MTNFDLKNIKHGLPVAKIKALNGKIYFVGGIVRDFYCNKVSKDIDVVITNIEFDKLYNVLKESGKVDLVGESFGIIKYKAPGCDEVDLALPRTERKIGSGYQGFEVYSDPFLSINTDLFRRDFTINAIAISIDGEVIDPYGGINHINEGVIHMVNPTAFNEDPLRMLRAIQFSVRFGFKISDETYEAILSNKTSIKEISVERWIAELDKVFYKAPTKTKYMIDLLISTGLYNIMFGEAVKLNDSFVTGHPNMIRADFYYNLIDMSVNSPSKFFKENLKGDIETYKTIKAIEVGSKTPCFGLVDCFNTIFNAYKISEEILNSRQFIYDFGYVLEIMKKNNLPLSFKELNINGDEIMEITGSVGRLVGLILDDVLQTIYNGDLKNDKDLIIQFLKNKYDNKTASI